MAMECKLCSKKFSNGKALGGHMRSHFAALPLPPKTPPQKSHELSTESSSSLVDCKKKTKKKSLKSLDPDEFLESESTRCGSSKRAKKKSRFEGFDDSFTVNDVALWLIMLSKDVWGSGGGSGDLLKMKGQSRKVYKCGECGKVFKASQGLGSHKKIHNEKITKKDLFDHDQVYESLVPVIDIDLNLPAEIEDEDEDGDGDNIMSQQ